MDRLVILSEELKKYFILIDGEKNKRSQWKCNIDECGKITDIGTRMIHLRYNHITKFYEIDQKLPPKDITKNAYLKLL